MEFSWLTIKKPVVALAPMSGVTDIAFRSIARRWGSDITFSEFISTDAIFYKVKAHTGKDPLSLTGEELLMCARNEDFWKGDKSCKLAEFIEEERPFIIQLFGPEPGHFKIAASILKERFKPDGFDINFGCPARSVVNNGAGSCLFLNPDAARRIIRETKDAAGAIPVSIKVRASFKNVGVMDFMKALGGLPIDNVTLHMRTYEQVHFGEPNWDIGKELKRYLADKNVTLIVNGGINSGAKARDVLEYTKADGVMVAQAALGNPFIFAEIKAALSADAQPQISYHVRVQTALEHARLMEKYKGEARGMLEMRKHLLWYFKGFPHASKFRQELSQASNLRQLEKILQQNPAL